MWDHRSYVLFYVYLAFGCMQQERGWCPNSLKNNLILNNSKPWSAFSCDLLYWICCGLFHFVRVSILWESSPSSTTTTTTTALNSPPQQWDTTVTAQATSNTATMPWCRHIVEPVQPQPQHPVNPLPNEWKKTSNVYVRSKWMKPLINWNMILAYSL